jgi:4-carboxymuconolactone decarboxylase
METDQKDREITDKILKAIERKYGFIPMTNQILSERPDMFIPAIGFSKAILENPNSSLEPKYRYLLAISAASALGSQYCIDIQIKHALDAGATKEEIMETLMIGAYMTMSRSQSIALREYDKQFNITKK